jgi:Protein of unknown function (DUF2721)
MNLDMTARIIQLTLAPVVMITSCALVLSGLLVRYGAVNDRMRAMAHERLELAHPTPETSQSFVAERVAQIEAQLPDLLHRHTLLHNAVLVVYIATGLFLVSMLIIAIAAAVNVSWLSIAILILFLAGTGALFIGVMIAIIEVRSSHRAVQYEVRRVIQI